MRALLFLAFLAPAILLAIRSQFFALVLYLWFTLAAPLDWIWTDLSALRLSLVLGLLVAVPREGLFRSRLPLAVLETPPGTSGLPNISHPMSVGTLLFLGTALLPQWWAIAPAVGWMWIDYLWKLFLVTLTAVSLISTERRLVWVVAVMGGSIAMNSAKAGIVSLLSGGVRFENGLRGAFSDNNGYALAVVMALPFIVAAAQNTRSRAGKWIWWISAAASVFTVISTFSRGGFLALAAATVTFIALQRRRMAGLTVLAAVVVVALLFAPIPKGYTERLATIQTYDEIDERSALSRLHLWQVAIDMVQEYPFGIGLFNYEVAFDHFDTTFGKYGQRRAVHSSHFEVLAEQGYLGAVVWLGLFGTAFFLTLRARSRSADARRPAASQHVLFTTSNALTASMVGFLVGGSFIAAALNELTWFTFAAVAALDRLSAATIAEPAREAIDADAPRVGAARQPAFRGLYRLSGGPTAGHP